MEICSVGAGLVKIAGVETEFFLTIDDSGTLRATVSINFFNTLKNVYILLARLLQLRWRVQPCLLRDSLCLAHSNKRVGYG